MYYLLQLLGIMTTIVIHDIVNTERVLWAANLSTNSMPDTLLIPYILVNIHQ